MYTGIKDRFLYGSLLLTRSIYFVSFKYSHEAKMSKVSTENLQQKQKKKVLSSKRNHSHPSVLIPPPSPACGKSLNPSDCAHPTVKWG